MQLSRTRGRRETFEAMQALIGRLAREQEGRRRGARAVGLAMILAGVLVLAGVGAYYGYGIYARAGLDEMSYTVERPASLPAFAADDGFIPVETADPNPSPLYGQASSSLADVSPPPRATETPGAERLAAAADEPITMPVAEYGLVYPASWIHPKYWRQAAMGRLRPVLGPGCRFSRRIPGPARIGLGAFRGARAGCLSTRDLAHRRRLGGAGAADSRPGRQPRVRDPGQRSRPHTRDRQSRRDGQRLVLRAPGEPAARGGRCLSETARGVPTAQGR